jgi:hypothetical protein
MYVDAEREGGMCTLAGDWGVGAYAEVGLVVEAKAGGGSLATLVSGGAMTGDKEDGGCADCGVGAVEERVGPDPKDAAGEDDDDAGAAATAAKEETAPVSRETSLSETALPEKNSPDVSEGSIDGAGGKMSDWNESDWW